MFSMSRTVLLLLILIVNSQAVERIQIQPNSYQEINLRYENLVKQMNLFELNRPWNLQSHTQGESFLFQLAPNIYQNGEAPDVGLVSWIQLELNPGFVFVNEMWLGSAGDNEVNYSGKEWRSTSGGTNQSFLQWGNQNKSQIGISMRAGRFYSQLGPGRHGQLLLGAISRPMDQFLFSYQRQFSPTFSARFLYQTSALDKIGQTKRFMSLHRIEFKGSRWYFALSEALLYSRQDQGIDPVYLNPFIFYHMEQLNGPSLAGNTMGSIEMGYFWGTNHVYSELLIDDIQLDNEVKGDLEPNEIGILSGFEYAGEKYYFNIEGVAISNRTYKTTDPTEWFLHRNVPIGYELGSDIGRINMLARYYHDTKWHLDAELDLIWQGEGDLNKSWDAPWEAQDVTMESGYSEPFPTGVVQKSSRFSIELMRHWNPERWIALGCYAENIDNVAHITGESDRNFGLSFGASWTLDYQFSFDQ